MLGYDVVDADADGEGDGDADDKSFFTISLMKSSRFKLLLLSDIAIKNSLLHRATLNPDRFHILIASSFDRTRFIL